MLHNFSNFYFISYFQNTSFSLCLFSNWLIFSLNSKRSQLVVKRETLPENLRCSFHIFITFGNVYMLIRILWFVCGNSFPKIIFYYSSKSFFKLNIKKKISFEVRLSISIPISYFGNGTFFKCDTGIRIWITAADTRWVLDYFLGGCGPGNFSRCYCNNNSNHICIITLRKKLSSYHIRTNLFKFLLEVNNFQ